MRHIKCVKFCEPVRVTYIGIIKTAGPEKRTKWLQQLQRLGARPG
jgi:hypothetical protein